MSLMDRFKNMFSAKANAVLDRAQNIEEDLDYAHNKAKDDVRTLTQKMADVATSKHKTVTALNKAKARAAAFESQAARGLQAQNTHAASDPVKAQEAYALAEAAMTDKEAADVEVQNLELAVANIEQQQANMVALKKQKEGEVREFGQFKEALKARHQAAQATADAHAASTGVDGSLSSIGEVTSRAVAAIEAAEARSAGLNELEKQGALSRPMDELTGASSRDRQLAALGGTQDNALAELAARMNLPAPGQAAAQLPAGENTIDTRKG